MGKEFYKGVIGLISKNCATETGIELKIETSCVENGCGLAHERRAALLSCLASAPK